MRNAPEPETARVSEVTPLRRRSGRVTAVIGDRRPGGLTDTSGTSGNVRALTAALAPHLSTADPELHGLAAALLSAQQEFATGESDAPSVERDRVRRQYFEAARDYCVAMEARGLAPPPGLIEAEHWLDQTASADESLPTHR